MITIIWYYILGRAEESSRRGDVVTNGFSILWRPDGIEINLRGAMARFSGRYPWDLLPQGVAALRVLYDCEPLERFYQIVEELESVGITRDDLDEVLGVDSKNAEIVLQAVPEATCPAGVGQEVSHVLAMDHRQLGKYIGEFL
jgi:hypothetical protein